MKIIDNIYGEEEIDGKVLIDLINSQELQRLKNISQMGLPQEYYHKPVFSRYEHSVGVLILLRRLGANLNEQIAGLLHDISHTAFSHTIDWVIGDPTKEDYQDNNYLKVLENSSIPEILMRHGINYKEMSNLEDFSLLEKEIPGLCADRVDYAIREFKYWLNPEIVGLCVGNLINYNGQIAFKSKEVAKNFAEHYLRCQNEHWAGDEAKVRYEIFANILKKALEKEIISLQDFNKIDEEIIKKLKESLDKEILNKLDLLEKKLIIKEDKAGILLRKKFRYVDPEVLINNQIKRLSEISKEYAERLEKEKLNSKKVKRVVVLR